MQHITPLHAPRRATGFSLIELMTVLAVIGVLATIAYPSYQEYAQRGRRGEARAALLEFRQQQERYMTQFGEYSTDMTKFKIQVGSDTKNPSYTLSAQKCDGKELTSCVKLIATPSANVPDAKAGNLSIDTLGNKDCTGPAKQDNFRICWP